MNCGRRTSQRELWEKDKSMQSVEKKPPTALKPWDFWRSRRTSALFQQPCLTKLNCAELGALPNLVLIIELDNAKLGDLHEFMVRIMEVRTS